MLLDTLFSFVSMIEVGAKDVNKSYSLKQMRVYKFWRIMALSLSWVCERLDGFLRWSLRNTWEKMYSSQTRVVMMMMMILTCPWIGHFPQPWESFYPSPERRSSSQLICLVANSLHTGKSTGESDATLCDTAVWHCAHLRRRGLRQPAVNKFTRNTPSFRNSKLHIDRHYDCFGHSQSSWECLNAKPIKLDLFPSSRVSKF